LGEVDLHIYDKELLLQEQSDSFKPRMILGESFYYYLLFGGDEEQLAYGVAEPKSESQVKFGSGFVAENLSSDKLSKLQNVQLDVYLAHRDFSLIPQKLFEKTKRDLYIDNLEEGLSLYREFQFGREKLSIVWFIPARFNEILGHKYTQHKSYHVSELMLRKAEQIVSDISSFAFAFYAGSSVFVCTIKNKQLQAINAYEVRSKEDLLYYTMLNHQNFGLKPKVDPLFLSGVFKDEKKEIDLMARYFSPEMQLLKFSSKDSENKTVPSDSNSLFYLLQA